AQDGWIHAAWVYDGGADLGKIYLDGVLDKEQGQRAPNGGGHLIFGGRNNGEAQYRGLVDDVAIWAEALADAEVAQLAAGGSPIASLTDADGDGFVDAWEQRYAGNLTDLGAGIYSQTFTAPDGTTDMEDGSVIFGAANSVKDNRLQLTIDGQGLGFSSFSVPGLAGSSEGFTATFDYELFDSPGANDPADGLSFNYGNAPLGDQGQAEEGMAGRPDVTENISFEVDTWRNGDAEQGVNISGVAGGADVGQLAFTNGVILEDDSRKTGSISISWSPETGASFATSGLTTNADFADVATGDFVASDDHTFNISARVGGANQDFFIDNLVIRAGEADFDEDGLSDLAEYNSGEVAEGASIVSVVEDGRGGDAEAIIGENFDEESLTFSDRTHQHNGAAFDAEGNLSTAGDTIVPLPGYLVGGDYILFANNARDNNPYTATVTADKATSWYLLVDNRLDGAAGNKNSPNSTDPVLGGTLQWIIDDGWERVNTGISPNGQADYTGVDESGDGVGAGQALNQFYSVYKLNSDEVSIVIGGQGIGGSNMLSLVAKTQASDSVVADKGTWGNDGTVGRPDQTTLGVDGGAPAGLEPSEQQLIFQDGLLRTIQWR
ncbi:MAG: LamG-like jellyroll fold domain-containing protein, partial [Verrucomicrobiales bacterium]